MNRPEINPDETIDRLLTGLRDVELPQGMERRILDAATEQTATLRGWNLAPAKSWALAAASIAIAAIAMSGIMLRSHPDKRQSTDIRRHDVPAAAPAPTQQTASSSAKPLQPPSMKHLVRSAPKQNAPATEKLSGEDALAINNMNAPSHPAPPMPLTDQEKLLLRVVHRAQPVELAMLNPEIRARENAEVRSEFDDFFHTLAAKSGGPTK